jgi:hypothetical protein
MFMTRPNLADALTVLLSQWYKEDVPRKLSSSV